MPRALARRRLLALQARGYLGGNAQGSGWRDGPRHTDRDARYSERIRQSRRSRYPEVAPDVAIPRQAQDRYVAPDALASTTGLTSQRRLVSLEEPGAHIEHEHLATLLGMSPERSPQGRPTLTCTTVKHGDFSPTVSRTAIAALAPRLATPARVSRAHPRALLHPIRLNGGHEAIRA